MHTFIDNQGRTWAINIHVAAAKEVRARVGVDLYKLVDDGFAGLGELLGDPVQLVDVIYVLCRGQAETQGITDEDFGRAMAGDAIERATDAFLAEFTDFFPNPRVRASLAKLIAKGNQMRDRLLDHAATELDRIDVESEARKLIASSGTSPASSASTPAP